MTVLYMVQFSELKEVEYSNFLVSITLHLILLQDLHPHNDRNNETTT